MKSKIFLKILVMLRNNSLALAMKAQPHTVIKIGSLKTTDDKSKTVLD